jgi:hypothetical protein
VDPTETLEGPPVVSPPPDADLVVDRVASNKDRWIGVDLPTRIDYLKRCIDGVVEVAEDWVRVACGHHGINPGSPLAGEEWLSGPMTTVRQLRLLAGALEQDGRPRPVDARTRPDGQGVVKVFPGGLLDRFLYYNMSAEVWIEPGKAATQGRIYREKAEGSARPGKVALVLGAGNISSIAPLDVAHKLFVEDEVVVLKMNPVNEYLGPYLERAFRSLINDGFLGVVYGGKEVGEHLCHHDRVDSLHLTGSDQTHDAIVWGADPVERSRRKAAGEPLLDKPFTSELGSVTPILVVPGRWSDSALDFQARHVASMVTHNASFNCNAGKVVALAQGWTQRDEFLRRLEQALATTPARRAYYPGAHERYQGFLRHYPKARAVGDSGGNVVPWTIIPDVPAWEDEYALNNEAFCGVLAEVSLDADDAPTFISRAVDFANEKVWGTLSCVILVDRATQRAHAEAIEDAIAGLRYGGIGINIWTGVNFGLGVTSWGAFPGHTPEAIESGSGAVHNTLLFDHPQKSVIRASFRLWPKPVWFNNHRTLLALGRNLTRFEAYRSPIALLKVALAGLRA